MWEKARVTMDFVEKVCGSIPLHKEMVEAWLTAKMPKNKPENGKDLEEIVEEISETIEEATEKVTVGFQKDEKGLFVRGGAIKSHLKDCANQIKDIFSPAIKNFRGKIANKLYIEEYHVYFHKNGEIVKDSDGSYEQPIHAMTRRGPINSLKIVNYLDKVSLGFTLMFMKDKEIDREIIEQLFEYSKIHGFGGERSMGEGRYNFSIVWE